MTQLYMEILLIVIFAAGALALYLMIADFHGGRWWKAGLLFFGLIILAGIFAKSGAKQEPKAVEQVPYEFTVDDTDATPYVVAACPNLKSHFSGEVRARFRHDTKIVVDSFGKYYDITTCQEVDWNKMVHKEKQ